MYNGVGYYNYNNNGIRDYNYNIDFDQANRYLENKFMFNQAPTPNFNKRIFGRARINHWDIGKAHYKEKELLRERYDDDFIENQFLFQRQKVSIFRFHLNFMEGIDWLFLSLAIIGILIGALALPVLSYLNAIIFSNVGNTSEDRENLSEEEIMKLNVKEEMNSNVKNELIFGCIELVGNIMGYGCF